MWQANRRRLPGRSCNRGLLRSSVCLRLQTAGEEFGFLHIRRIFCVYFFVKTRIFEKYIYHNCHSWRLYHHSTALRALTICSLKCLSIASRNASLSSVDLPLYGLPKSFSQSCRSASLSLSKLLSNLCRSASWIIFSSSVDLLLETPLNSLPKCLSESRRAERKTFG